MAPAVLVPVEEWVADAREPNAKEDKDEAQPINHSRPVLVTHAYTQDDYEKTISDIRTIEIIKKHTKLKLFLIILLNLKGKNNYL